MKLSFTLSMPGNNSWDGKWTGENKNYVVIRDFVRVPIHDGKPIEPGYFSYSFGDGWRASITVRSVGTGIARTLAAKSAGFCGYEWMIDSIVRHGKIQIDQREPAELA